MVYSTFTYDRSEYLRAFRRYRSKSLGSIRDLSHGTAAIVGGVYLLASGSTVPGAFILVSGALLIAMVVFVIVIQPILIYNAHPTLKERYSLGFSDSGITFSTSTVDSSVKWSLYSTWIQDDEFFMLLYGKRELLIVPKRALDQHGCESLRGLLANYIGPEHIAGG